MRYLLDTDILSNVVKPSPSPSLLAWLAEQGDADLFIAALTQAKGCIVVTDNEKDFAGVQLLNPMRDA